MGPSSQISKLLLVLLVSLVGFYVFMDCSLFFRVQNFPVDRGTGENFTSSYASVSWVGCEVSPLCDVTVKALLLDQTNHYLFAPLAKITDDILHISQVQWITPNSISFFHVFVAVLAGKCVSSDNLPYRRLGVVLFEIRTFLDDMDGHVARARKNIRGERSEIGTSGYYIDGLCDALGCVALMIGAFVFLKNNPPRRGYMQLPTVASDSKDCGMVYKAKVTTKKVVNKVCCFSAQMLISSTAWNRYIALYQDKLERNNVTAAEYKRQNIVFKSSFFFCVAWLWRIVNVHNLLHFLLLSIFCDKLWEFLRAVQYVGFGALLTAICVAEIHILDAQNFIFKNLS